MTYAISIPVDAAMHCMRELEFDAMATQLIRASLAGGGAMQTIEVRERDATMMVSCLTRNRNHEIEPTELSVPSLDVFGWADYVDDQDWFVRVIIVETSSAEAKR